MSDKNPTVGRNKKFVKDIGIYAIGNLGSRFVTFLLVPLYTFYIQPSQYGYYDICFTAILILMPFLSLQLRDGAFRFLMDADNLQKKKAVVSFVYKTLVRNSIIAFGICGFVYFFANIQYLWLMFWLLVAMSVYEVIIQVVRGLGNTKYFVSAGIINSFLICLFSIIFVVIFKMQVEGIFYANILSRFTTLLILELRLHIIRKYFRYNFKDKAINKDILKYSIPLLPGTICWWLVGSSNKFFIQHYLGLEENGLYAVATKFTAILETVAYVFYQAWQETAIRQYNSPDRNKFFSLILNNYVYFLTGIVIIFSFGIKLNYFWIVDANYQASAQYLYLLAIPSMLFALSAFFDMGYQCSKKTIYTLPGILSASIINIAGNYYLIQEYKVYGIIISSIVTFLFLFIYRIIDTRKFFKIKFNKNAILSFILLTISCIAFNVIQSAIMSWLYLIVVTIIMILFLPEGLKNIILAKIKKIKC